MKNKIKLQKNEMELSNVPDKKLKVRVIKMLTKLGKRMDEHRTSKKKWEL